MATVTIFHNNNPRDGMFRGYDPADSVTEVFRYETRDGDREVLSFAYDLFNVGDDPQVWGEPDDRAVAYRARHNRSLSIGDVVRTEDAGEVRFYAVARVGWQSIDTPHVKNTFVRGMTTPIDLGPAIVAEPEEARPCDS